MAELGRIARRLWPDNRANRLTWIRSIRVVRQTSRGWVVERRMEAQQ